MSSYKSTDNSIEVMSLSSSMALSMVLKEEYLLTINKAGESEGNGPLLSPYETRVSVIELVQPNLASNEGRPISEIHTKTKQSQDGWKQPKSNGGSMTSISSFEESIESSYSQEYLEDDNSKNEQLKEASPRLPSAIEQPTTGRVRIQIADAEFREHSMDRDTRTETPQFQLDVPFDELSLMSRKVNHDKKRNVWFSKRLEFSSPSEMGLIPPSQFVNSDVLLSRRELLKNLALKSAPLLGPCGEAFGVEHQASPKSNGAFDDFLSTCERFMKNRMCRPLDWTKEHISS